MCVPPFYLLLSILNNVNGVICCAYVIYYEWAKYKLAECRRNWKATGKLDAFNLICH